MVKKTAKKNVQKKTTAKKTIKSLDAPAYVEKLFSGRISRANYLAGFLLFFVGVPALVAIITPLLAGIGLGLLALLLMFVLWVADIAYGVSFGVRRFHDIGKDWQWILWLLVPIVNIYFLFLLLLKPGDGKTNKFGKAPEKKVNLRDLLALE